MKLLRRTFLLLLFVSTMAAAEQPVGAVLLAKGVVTASNSQSGVRTLAKGSEVFLGETISTASDSYVVLKLADNSKLSLRPQSEMNLEKFNQQAGQEEALFDLLKGGLRALSGEIGKKKPEQYRVETSVATVGIRGTDFLVRLCLDDCQAEEFEFGDQSRQKSGPKTGGAATKQKELRKLDQQDNPVGNSFIECKPVAEIKQGLYAAVFEGKIYVRKRTEEVDLEAVEAVFAEETEILCLGEIPHFIMQDDFLSGDPDNTITLFNILKNLDEDQQRCEIPEA
ncbi:MAG: FecR family protein [bacterium]